MSAMALPFISLGPLAFMLPAPRGVIPTPPCLLCMANQWWNIQGQAGATAAPAAQAAPVVVDVEANDVGVADAGLAAVVLVDEPLDEGLAVDAHLRCVQEIPAP